MNVRELLAHLTYIEETRGGGTPVVLSIDGECREIAFVVHPRTVGPRDMRVIIVARGTQP